MLLVDGPVYDELMDASRGAKELLAVSYAIQFQAVVEIMESSPRLTATIVTDRRCPSLTEGEFDQQTERYGRRLELISYMGPERLHAKIYLFKGPRTVAFVGSANLTAPAIGMVEPANLELMFRVEDPSLSGGEEFLRGCTMAY